MTTIQSTFQRARRLWKSYTDKYGNKYNYSKCSDTVHVDGDAHNYNYILPRGVDGNNIIFSHMRKDKKMKFIKMKFIEN